MNEEMCGKEFRKYVESTAIIIFFRLFPDEEHDISFCRVRGVDGNPFDPNQEPITNGLLPERIPG